MKLVNVFIVYLYICKSYIHRSSIISIINFIIITILIIILTIIIIIIIIITFSIELAGNPIIDFKELKRLSQCTYKVKNMYPSQSLSLHLTLLGPVLRTLSLSDIHFGRCPIVDENGEEFVEVLRLIILMLCKYLLSSSSTTSSFSLLLFYTLYYCYRL